jgi:hypothetical protein
MADEWYYTNQGQQKGPVTTAELKQLAQTHQLLPSDLIWREGLPKWMPANSTKGLFPEAPAAAVTPAVVAPTPVAPVAAVEDEPRPAIRRRRLDDEEDFDEDRPRRRRSSGSNRGLVIGLIAGGVGLLVLAVVIVVLVLVLRGSSSSNLTLRNGQVTVDGELTTSDAFDAHRLQSRSKTYTIYLTGGRDYDINMRSNLIDSYLRLETSSGQILAQDDDGGGFPNARIVYHCPRSGTYRIICTTFAPALGPYTLSVQER